MGQLIQAAERAKNLIGRNYNAQNGKEVIAVELMKLVKGLLGFI